MKDVEKGVTMVNIKTGFEIWSEVDSIGATNQNSKWVSLDWLEEQVKKRRDMFKGLGDISELSWVLKLLEVEEKHSTKW